MQEFVANLIARLARWPTVVHLPILSSTNRIDCLSSSERSVDWLCGVIKRNGECVRRRGTFRAGSCGGNWVRGVGLADY